jgi:hypothetical protein
MMKSRRFMDFLSETKDHALARARNALRIIAKKAANVRFSNRPFGVKRFQAIRRCSADVAHGLALLFGIGTKAVPLWDSRMRWSNLCSGLAVRRNGRSKRTCELTSSIVPRGTSFHRSAELEFPSIGFDPVEFSCCCRGLLPGPAELGAVHPDAVHDHVLIKKTKMECTKNAEKGLLEIYSNQKTRGCRVF